MISILYLVAAASGIIALYGHRVGLTEGIAAPFAIALGFGSLAIISVMRMVNQKRYVSVSGADSNSSAWLFFWIGIAWAFISVINSALKGPLSIADMGVIALILGMPFFLIFVDRERLFLCILQICLVMALVDAAANLLAVFGLVDLEISARVDEYGLRTRYPGLSGNTHAAGIVAFMAIFYMTLLIRRDGFAKSAKWISFGIIILISLFAIDARRYLAMALLCSVFVFPVSRRVPLFVYASTLVIVLITATFRAATWDVGNYLRSELMINGWIRSQDHPLIGEGLFYRTPTDLIPTFDSLSSAGVTESAILEYAIAFGILGSILFFTASFMIIVRDRRFMPMAILLSMLTAEMFFGGSLRGLLGSMTYYCCLVGCLKNDEIE